MSNRSYLIIQGLNNTQRGKTYQVHQPVTVGRSNACDIFIADVLASRKQARFFRNADGSLLVEDLGSSNGTFVNGKKISRHMLSEGEIIRLGNTEFQARQPVRQTIIEVVDAPLPQKTQIVKKATSISVPSLNSMKADDYFRAIGIERNAIIAGRPTAFEELQRKTRNFAVLFEVSSMIQKTQNSDEMIDAVLLIILKVFKGDVIHVMMLDDKGRLVPKTSKVREGQLAGHTLISRTVCRYVMDKQCGVAAQDLRNDIRFSGSESIVMGASGSILAAPIIINTRSNGLISLCTAETMAQPAEEDLDLLCVVAGMLGNALHNIELEKERTRLQKEIIETQKEVIFTMGAIVETRSKETGNHVKRVAEYSKLLALLYGLDAKQAELLKQASPMHDIGKVGIPDRILNKPGRLDPDEWEIMKTHARIGFDMLSHSSRHILKAAAVVAHEHHEKWDGTGYPRGISGDKIHIFGRITAVADVFDALGSERCYKKAWSLEKILSLFSEQKGKHFDPKLVDIFFEHIDKFIGIRDAYRDEF